MSYSYREVKPRAVSEFDTECFPTRTSLDMASRSGTDDSGSPGSSPEGADRSLGAAIDVRSSLSVATRAPEVSPVAPGGRGQPS